MGLLLLLLYNLLTPALAVLYFGWFMFSPRRGLLKKFFSELRERLAFPGADLPQGGVWLHAASMGEVRAVSRLVAALREKRPDLPVVITTSSSSGRAQALKLTPHARLLPLDFYPLMSAFVDRLRPRLLLVAETELWPNLLVCAAASGAGIYIVNARISAKTRFLYRAAAPLTRKILTGVRKVLAQSEADARGYASLLGDASRTAVTGNMKYDALDARAPRLDEIRPVLEKLSWAGAKIWTAASTHRAEEEAVLDAFLALKAADPGLKLVIAPRHSERAKETRKFLEARKIPYLAWSERNNAPSVPHPSSLPPNDRRTGIPHPSSPDCLLVDETGWLTAFFSLSAAAFVGGTLAEVGGHNLLEPAAFAKPVVFGPHVWSTREAADALLKARGGFSVADGEDLRARLSVLLKDPAQLKAAGENARKALEGLQGATAVTLKEIEPWLR